MPFVPQEPKPFTRQGIEWLNPGQIGVYGIYNLNAWIYIGRGDIRDRLLAHLNGDKPEILLNAPTYYVARVTQTVAVATALERQLIAEYRPICNERVG